MHEFEFWGEREGKDSGDTTSTPFHHQIQVLKKLHKRKPQKSPGMPFKHVGEEEGWVTAASRSSPSLTRVELLCPWPFPVRARDRGPRPRPAVRRLLIDELPMPVIAAQYCHHRKMEIFLCRWVERHQLRAIKFVAGRQEHEWNVSGDRLWNGRNALEWIETCCANYCPTRNMSFL